MSTRRVRATHHNRLSLEAASTNFPTDINAADGLGKVNVEAGADNALPKVTMSPAYSGGLLRVDGFSHPVVVDLATLRASAAQYPLLKIHNSTAGVGHTTKLDNNGRTLNASGLLSIPNEHSQEVAAGQTNGFNWQPSVGVRIDPERTTLIPKGKRLTANGQTFPGPVIFAQNGLLREISFVPLGGDDHASARLSATARTSHMTPELAEFIEAAGFDPKTVNADQQAFFQLQLEAAAKTDDKKKTPPADDRTVSLFNEFKKSTEELQAAQKKELDDLKKVAEELKASAANQALDDKAEELGAEKLTFKVQGKDINLLAHAKAERWSIDKFELEALRESRHAAPAGYVHAAGGGVARDALAGALLIKTGFAIDSPSIHKNRHYQAELQAAAGGDGAHFLGLDVNDAMRDRVMNAANSYRGMSLPDLCREVCRLENNPIGIGFNYPKQIQAAMSTHTLAWIFSTNFAAQLLMGWDGEDDTTVGWCAENPDVANFLEQERARMLGATSLTRHKKGGAADHVDSMNDVVETYKLARYSRQFVVDEIDILNDRFGALSQTPPKELGEAARRLRPDLVYGILKRNPNMKDGNPLFSTANSNLYYSATLADATLQRAITKFGLISESGVPLNLVPDTFIGPKTLDFAIDKLVNSAVRFAQSEGDKNVLRGKLPNIKTDARLDNSHVDPSDETTVAGSLTDWYLANSKRPPIEVGTLRGNSPIPGVTTWKKSGEEGQWLWGCSVKHDIAAKAIRTQTIQCNKAEAAP